MRGEFAEVVASMEKAQRRALRDKEASPLIVFCPYCTLGHRFSSIPGEALKCKRCGRYISVNGNTCVGKERGIADSGAKLIRDFCKTTWMSVSQNMTDRGPFVGTPVINGDGLPLFKNPLGDGAYKTNWEKEQSMKLVKWIVSKKKKTGRLTATEARQGDLEVIAESELAWFPTLEMARLQAVRDLTDKEFEKYKRGDIIITLDEMATQ